MPEYLSPGVYVEEVDTGAKTIEGVSTSTAGFVGMTLRGPVAGENGGTPQLVTSYSDFERQFGGYFDLGTAYDSSPSRMHNALPHAVSGFFNNGGKRVYIARAVPTGATVAEGTLLGGMETRLASDNSLAAGDEKKIKPASLRGIQAGTKLELLMTKNGLDTSSGTVTVASVDSNTGIVTLTANLTVIFEARYTRVRTDEKDVNSGVALNGSINTLGAPGVARPATFALQAASKGSWGKSIDIQAGHESAARTTYVSVAGGAVDGNNPVTVASVAGFYANAWVEINRGNTKFFRKVKSVDTVTTTLILDGKKLVDVAVGADGLKKEGSDETSISTCEFFLRAAYGTTVEQWTGLTLENIANRYFITRINNESSLIVVKAGSSPADTHPLFFPTGDWFPTGGMTTTSEVLRSRLITGGSDGATPVTDSMYIGVDGGPGLRTALKALEDVDVVSIIAIPGISSQAVQGAMIEQCERLKDRFAILDPENRSQTLTQIQTQRQNFDTKYAAIYYPRLTVLNPLTNLDISMVPSGHMAGIYARTDIERGVHKAPANEVIRGISGLEVTVNKGEQDILNPMPVNINVLRDFRADGRGFRVWGARCITSDTDWKYINVRRLFIFIEESIDQGTQWVVFEPNDEPTWARVRRSVSNFLTNVWRDGALQGKKPDEAFFVRCDRTTMTQDDIDNGRLIMLIGIAPVKPAEFVIFRIGQWTGGSSVDEG